MKGGEPLKRIKRSERRTTSIYVSDPIWQKFKEGCKQTGQSTCHVLESFMYGFNVSLKKANIVVSPLPAINVTLNVSREVTRPRRASKYAAGMNDPPEGMSFAEFADRQNNPWRYNNRYVVHHNPRIRDKRR